MKKGVDISAWQGVIDWSRVKGQIDFVIPREGYRQMQDQYFLRNVRGCIAQKIPIPGVYHFLYAMDNQEVIAEAESCLRSIEEAGLTKEIIVWCDFEYDSVVKAKKKGVILGKSECILFTKTFCEFFSKRGYKTGIYTNLDYYLTMYDQETLSKYPIWLADYTGGPDKPCLYQQYTSSGRVNGISGSVDMNYYFGEDVSDIDVGNKQEETMSKTEKAIRWMESHANDNSHGYDQAYRWGERGDYDCSSAVISAWQEAGVPVRTKGATYTGNMYSVFTKNGFEDVTASVNLKTGAGLKRGDILLNHVHHVAMYCGSGMEVEASINEKGRATGGQPGDQTGKEFLIRSYRNYPWNCVLRFSKMETTSTSTDTSTNTSTIKSTDSGNVLVRAGQIHSVNFCGHQIQVDGYAGTETQRQKVKILQTAMNLDYKAGLDVDGSCGQKTIAALGEHYVKRGETQHMVTATEILLYLNGYNPGGVESPGKFGKGCQKAVEEFQRKNGLPVTGKCDAETFLKLIK